MSEGDIEAVRDFGELDVIETAPTEDGWKTFEVAKATKAQLLAFAAAIGVEVDKRARVAELREQLAGRSRADVPDVVCHVLIQGAPPAEED